MRRAAAYPLLAAFVFFVPAPAFAADLPSGYHAVSGTSNYSTSADGSSGTLNATSAVTIGEWSGGFNVKEGKTFTANLPAGGAHLSRDLTTNVSEIWGTLNVPQGRFFLVNTSGIVFTPTARVNASGLVASSLDILNSDFSAGQYHFRKPSGKSPSFVSNAAKDMAIGAGGLVLLGGAVESQAIVHATTGSVLLAAGEAITVNLDSSGLISAVIDAPAQSAPAGYTDAVKNSGQLRSGGDIVLTAAAADGVFNNLVNQTSVGEATVTRSTGGHIELLAGNGRLQLAGRANPGTGGRIRMRAKNAVVNASLDGYFALEGNADTIDVNGVLGANSPLLSVDLEGGTLRVTEVDTVGAQRYVNARTYGDSGFPTSGFETQLNGNLSASGQFGSILLLGVTRLNADVTLKTLGDSAIVWLGYNDGLTPGRLDGAHALTIDADHGGVLFQGNGRAGGSYFVGTSAAPLSGLTILRADSADFDDVQLFSRTLDLTANSISMLNDFETTGAMKFLATDLSLDGFFRTHGGGMDLKAATIRMAGEFDASSGGSIFVNGPATLDTAFPTASSSGVKPVVRTGQGSVFFAGPVRLNDDALVSTLSGGAVTFNSTINANHWAADDLAIEAGTGDVVLNGGIGYNPAAGQGTRIGRLSIRSARNVTFGSYASVSSLYQAGSVIPATTQFRGFVDAYHSQGIDLNGYNFVFNAPVATHNGGRFTVTNLADSTGTRPGTFATTAAADFALDGAFLQDGAGPSRVAGDIRTTNDSITFQRAVTLAGDVTMSTGAGAGNVTFGSTLFGTTSGQEDLTLNAGTGNVSFNGQVGYNPNTGAGVRIGRLVVQNAFDVTAANIVTAASILQNEGAGTTTLRGFLRTNQSPGISLTGNNFTLNGAAATGGQIVVNYRGFATLNGSYSPTPTVRKRA